MFPSHRKHQTEIVGNYSKTKCPVQQNKAVAVVVITAMTVIEMPMFMVLSSWHSHCARSLGSSDKCSTAPDGRRPLNQVNGLEPLIRLEAATPSPFTQPKS